MSVNAPWEEVLSFWFGELDERGAADAEHAKIWWKKDPQFDALLRERFLGHHQAIASGCHICQVIIDLQSIYRLADQTLGQAYGTIPDGDVINLQTGFTY